MAIDLIMPRPLPEQPHYGRHNFFPREHDNAPASTTNVWPAQSQQRPQQPRSQQPPPTALFTQQSPSRNALGDGLSTPISPKSQMGRGIRPFYIPAVLRPPEYPSKAPSTLDSSGSDGERTPIENARSSGSFISLPGLGNVLVRTWTRRSTGGLKYTKDLDDEDAKHNFAMFPEPTGKPSDGHWKPDSQSTICDDASCKRQFNYFTRRHHCRRCGNIFCDSHSRFSIPLDQDVNFNPRGIAVRSCSHCYAQFRDWRSRNNSQASSSGSDSTTSHKDSTPGAQTSPASPIGTSSVKGTPNSTSDAALSVPTDWNWSTF